MSNLRRAVEQRQIQEHRRKWDRIIPLLNKYRIQPPAPAPKHIQYFFGETVYNFIAPLDNARTAEALVEGTASVMHSLESALNQMPSTVNFANEPLPATLACKPGCNYCCHIRVTTSAPQVLFLADTLRKTLTPEAQRELFNRMREFEQATSVMQPLEKAIRILVCPLNLDGMCIGYSSRPISCVGYHSFDVQKCIEGTLPGDEEVYVPQDQTRREAQALHTVALITGMKALELQEAELELIPALRIALTDEEAGSKYLNGEPVFAEADEPAVRAQANDFSNRGVTPLRMKQNG